MATAKKSAKKKAVQKPVKTATKKPVKAAAKKPQSAKKAPVKTAVKSGYAAEKARARREAISWKRDSAGKRMSSAERARNREHFGKLARRYGLTEEFRKRGII